MNTELLREYELIDDIAIAIGIIDREGILVFSNSSFQNLLGYTEDELDSKNIADLTHPDYVVVDAELLDKLTNRHINSYSIEKIYINRDSQPIWVQVNTSLIKNLLLNEYLYMIAVTNIMKWKLAEIELQNYHEHLEELVEERTLALKELNSELAWQASHDTLTDLVNRVEFKKLIELVCTQSKVYDLKHTLCHLDLDRFKAVNDTCGHSAGDELLRQVSSLFRKYCRRKTDILSRLGSDEFGLLFYECSIEKALQVLEQLQKEIKDYRFTWEDRTFSIEISIGIVEINSSNCDSNQILSAADDACYVAKNRGRDRIHIYEVNDLELTKQQVEVQWLPRLCEAIEQSQFLLYSQPLLALNETFQNKRHCEILIRLLDGSGEVLSPGIFLPAAERYNLMPKIDRWVISKCFEILSQNYETIGNHALYMINLSGASVNDDSFLRFLKEQLTIYQIPTECICFEITETVAITNLSKAAKLIRDLQSMGLLFALDDFGSGMSSFIYLKNLPVNYLKIDGGLIEDMVNDQVSYAMVEAINRVGHLMNVRTVAEYVSDETILKAVKDLKMDYAQGFCIAKPQPLKFPF